MLDLARGLKELGTPVAVGCPTISALAKGAAKLEIHTYCAPKKNYLPRMLGIIRRALAQGEVDLIHAHNGVSHIIATAAIALAGRGQCVSTHHFLAPARTKRKGLSGMLTRSIHSWAANRTACFIAISHAVAQACSDRAPNVPTHVIHNGIFPAKSGGRSASDIRAEFSIPADVRFIVCAARLDPEKSVETLIEAIKLLRHRMPDIFCLIAGEGKERDRLQSLIETLGLTQFVRLAGFQEDVGSIIEAADVFVLPSFCEPLGLVILEAMYLKTPVIAAAAGGPLELIENKKTGLLFTPKDSADLSYKLQHLLSDNKSAESIIRGARTAVEQQFNAIGMSVRILDVYRSVLAANR